MTVKLPGLVKACPAWGWWLNAMMRSSWEPTFLTGLGLKHSKWQRLSQVINSGSFLASYASMQLSMEVMVHHWEFIQALFAFVHASVIPVGRAVGSFVVPLWLGGDAGENYCSPANTANQFCLISHCTLSPTSPPTERRDSVILCLSAAEGKRWRDLPHRDKLTLHCHLSCQSVGRQSHCLTILSISFMFCHRRMLTHWWWDVCTTKGLQRNYALWHRVPCWRHINKHMHSWFHVWLPSVNR